MAGRSSAATIEAMRLVLDAGMTPYAAARRVGIDLSTMYRSKLYKQWVAGDLIGLRKAMNQTAPKPRYSKKRERYRTAT